MSQIKDIPVPLFKIDNQFHILDQSDSAVEMFGLHSDLRSFVDEGSKKKMAKYLRPPGMKKHLELNFLSGTRLVVCEVFQNWNEDGVGNIVCMPFQDRVDTIQYAVSELRERLTWEEQEGAAAIEQVNYIEQESGQLEYGLINHIRDSMLAIREILSILQNDFLAIGKGPYIDLLLKEIDAVDENLPR